MARRAGMHRPFYTDSVYGNTLGGDVGFTQDLRGALERVFFQFEVARPLSALKSAARGTLLCLRAIQKNRQSMFS